MRYRRQAMAIHGSQDAIRIWAASIAGCFGFEPAAVLAANAGLRDALKMAAWQFGSG